MFATARCMAAPPSFMKRSLEEFKRRAGIAWRLETLETPTRSYPILEFNTPASLGSCKTMADRAVGGYSTAEMEFVEGNESTGAPAHAVFKGRISNELPRGRPDVQRTGYAAFRTLEPGFSLFGRLYHDTTPYAYLALRLKSDSRKYFINIQTDSIVETDIHQHRLYPSHPGEWETVLVNWSDFVRTNHGVVVEPQTEMLRSKVRTVGLGLIDRIEGDYKLKIAGVWASNGLSEEEERVDQELRRREREIDEVD